VYAESRVLDPAYGSKTADVLYVLKNAKAYYNGECEWEDVGVKAIDDYTLQYTLDYACPYFESILTWVCFMPCNREFGETMGEDFGIDNWTILYNGAFIMEEFEPQTRRVLVRNENYWDLENIHIEKIVERYNAEASTLAPELFQKNETMEASMSASDANAWLADPQLAGKVRPSRSAFNYSYWYAFNFNPTYDESYNPDNYLKAANNLNFRKSIFHALDRINLLLTETVDEASAQTYVQNTITPKAYAVADGVDYTQMGNLAAFANTESFDVEKALDYKAAAIPELEAAGVTFPVVLYMPYDTSESDNVERAQICEQMLENTLGSDYIDIQLECYPSTDYLNNTRRPGNYSFMEVYWGPDYADPYTFTDPFRLVQKYSYIYMADGMAEETTADDPEGTMDRLERYWKNSVYDEMVWEAEKIVDDLTERYTILANAEAWLIENAFIIPYALEVPGYVASYLNPFEAQYAPFGVSENRYKYQWVYAEPIGLELYNQLDAEWNAEREARLAEDK
jgi:oligopeptide transport system substrate-binding protein